MDDYVRKKIEQGIRLHLESYQSWKVNKWTGGLLGYSNKADFWYGVIVGNLLELSRRFHLELFKTEPPNEFWDDVWDLIALHQKDIKDIIRKW